MPRYHLQNECKTLINHIPISYQQLLAKVCPKHDPIDKLHC